MMLREVRRGTEPGGGGGGNGEAGREEAEGRRDG